MGPKKRPAASVTGSDAGSKALKKEPKDEEEAQEASSEQIKDMMGKEDEEVEQFWNKLSQRQQNTVWKRFEAQRMKEGTDQVYKQSVQGHGRNQKAASLVKLYIKTGSTKSPAFMDHLVTLRNEEVYKEVEKWIPFESMKTKYGPTELKARVQAGTVEVRKSASDPRFPEFRDVETSKINASTKTKEKSGKVHSKATWSEFKMLEGYDLQGVTPMDFLHDEEDDGESGGEDDAQTLAIRLLDPKTKKKKSAEKTESAALKEFETASALAEGKGTIPHKALADSQKKLKVHLKKVQKKVEDEKMGKELDKALEALEAIDQETPAGVAKKALNNAAMVGKRALKSLTA